MTPTTAQLNILRHALAWPQCYRNHYNTDKGCFDYEDCETLCEAGLMIRQIMLGQRGFLYKVTNAGIQVLRDAEAQP